jgi:hypothetical protein
MRAALLFTLVACSDSAPGPCSGRQGILCASLSVGPGWSPWPGRGATRSLFYVPSEDEVTTVSGALIVLVGAATAGFVAAVTVAAVRLSTRDTRPRRPPRGRRRDGPRRELTK